MTDTATDNKAKRDAIIRKVRALLAKTTENGAGEAEAMAAAEKAADLMAEYDLAFTDIREEIEAEKIGVIRRQYRQGNQAHPVTQYCVLDVAKFWDVRAGLDRHGQLLMFGLQDDVQAAWNMLDMLRMAADTEFANFWQSPQRPYGVKFNTARASFMMGFHGRVNRRIRQMKIERSDMVAAREAQRALPRATGSSLVIVKNEIVDARFKPFAKSEGIATRARSRTRSASDGHSYTAGQAAGDRAGIAGRAARIGGN